MYGRTADTCGTDSYHMFLIVPYTGCPPPPPPKKKGRYSVLCNPKVSHVFTGVNPQVVSIHLGGGGGGDAGIVQ